MERLHTLLSTYNATIPKAYQTSWSKQYLATDFPLYWKRVYQQLEALPRDRRIVEVGAGQGDITAICCYLGFSSIISYERDIIQAELATKKIATLFHRQNVVHPQAFPREDGRREEADILIIVNCVYAEENHNKASYLQQLYSFYVATGYPKLVLLEVIDDSFRIEDPDFPLWVRLSQEDVKGLFPHAEIEAFNTYKYPINKRSKCLYVIKNEAL